jgi:hypothetical protein
VTAALEGTGVSDRASDGGLEGTGVSDLEFGTGRLFRAGAWVISSFSPDSIPKSLYLDGCNAPFLRLDRTALNRNACSIP